MIHHTTQPALHEGHTALRQAVLWKSKTICELRTELGATLVQVQRWADRLASEGAVARVPDARTGRMSYLAQH